MTPDGLTMPGGRQAGIGHAAIYLSIRRPQKYNNPNLDLHDVGLLLAELELLDLRVRHHAHHVSIVLWWV